MDYNNAMHPTATVAGVPSVSGDCKLFGIMLKSSAIGKALEKPFPTSIPLSGPRALENDFCVCYVEFPANDWKFLVESAQIGGYSGRLWVQEKDGRECSLLKGSVTGSNAKILIAYSGKPRTQNPLNLEH